MQKAVARSRQWDLELDVIFPDIRGPIGQPEADWYPLVQKMKERVVNLLCHRIKTVEPLNDRPSRLEATALRGLLLALAGQSTEQLSYGRDVQQPFDESLTSMVLRDLRAESDFGLALTLRSQLLGQSTAFNARLMREYTTLLSGFRHALQPLLNHIDCRDLIPPDSYSYTVFEAWVRKIPPTAEQFWTVQDYLGSTGIQVYLQTLHHERRQNKNANISIAPAILDALRHSPSPHKNLADRHGRTLLHIAAQCNFPDVIEAMLGPDSQIDARTRTNSTALHYAASMGYIAACAMLLKGGADPNARDRLDRTPLHYAAIADRDKVVALFLIGSVTVLSVQDGIGRTPFMWAITGRKNQSDGCCELLLQHLKSTDYETVDFEGHTVLHLAVNSMEPGSKQQIAILETVTAKCPGLINVQSHTGDTVLSRLSARLSAQPGVENLQLTRRLLGVEGIDAGLRNMDGMTALHHAAWNGNLELCRLLGLRVDGGVLSKCNAGLTPCQYATKHGHAEVALLLQRFEDRARAYASDPQFRG